MEWHRMGPGQTRMVEPFSAEAKGNFSLEFIFSIKSMMIDLI